MISNLRHLKAATQAVALLALVCGASASPADTTTARIPYKTIAELFDGFAKLKAKDKVELDVRLVHAPQAKPAAPIRMQLDSKSGRRELTVDENGALVDFPLTDALRKENPWLLSNQPKGTLDLHAGLRIKYPGQLTAPLQYYRQALDQVNSAIKSQAGLLAILAPKVKTVVFIFDPTLGPVVQVRSNAGERSLSGDTNGIVRLELSYVPKDAADSVILPAVPRQIAAE